MNVILLNDTTCCLLQWVLCVSKSYFSVTASFKVGWWISRSTLTGLSQALTCYYTRCHSGNEWGLRLRIDSG